MFKNLDFVDDFVAHNDSLNNQTWYNEGEIRNSLIQRARQSGADWVLCIDPDERFERGSGEKIRKLIDGSCEKVIYGFRFCELFTPTAFRIDGVWGQKRKWVLFPLLDGQVFMNQPLHSAWWPQNSDYRYEMTDVRLYHLKMIDERHREQRRQIYNLIDAKKEWQPIGYDYLVDEKDMVLHTIEENRDFSPAYRPFDFSVMK